MMKIFQKIVLLVAIITVISHSIFPHFHHEKQSATTSHYRNDEERSIGKHHHNNEDDRQSSQHNLFSFAQLDENFVPLNSQNNSFELPHTYLSAFLVTYLLDDFPVNTKTHFGCYKVFPPPEKYFSSSSRRGPPTV